jgi:hypothetical protein
MWEPLRKLIYGPPPGELTPTPAPYDPQHEPPPLGDVIRRGAAAVRLLGDPTLAEAFHEIRVEVYQSFVGSKPTETVTREEAYRMLQALELVRQKLIHYRDAAKLRQDREAA